MKIKKLRVKNFRNFEEEEFNFESNFTVVIGDNGLGKSTVLHALRVACSTYILGIEDYKKHISKSEIRIKNFGGSQAEQLPVEVEVIEWEWLGVKQNTTFKRELPSKGGKTTISGKHVEPAKSKGVTILNQLNTLGLQDVDVPVIAYFGTGRLHGAGQNRDTSKGQVGRRILTYGYENWFDMKATSYKYSSWLKGLDDSTAKNQDLLTAFRRAIVDAIPNINKDFRIRVNELRFKVEINNESGKESDLEPELPIELLSDGYQVMIEMVAELAYKCIILNAHHGVEAVRNTYGVVMIDELDMHLHPNWQKRVVADLSRAFPKIQFIATTHSPFIVNSLAKSQLINLANEDNAAEIAPDTSTLEDVSEVEMKIPDFQRSVKFVELVRRAEEYFTALKTMNKESNIAALKEKLDAIEFEFSDNPVYVALLRAERRAKNI